MIDFDGIDGFDDQVSALENSLQDATAFTRAFTGELTRLNLEAQQALEDLGINFFNEV